MTEIAGAHSIPSLNWKPEYVDECKVIGQIEGFDIYSMKMNNETLFAFLDENKNLLTYMVVLNPNSAYPEYLILQRIENLSGISGLATTLAAGVRKLAGKFMVSNTEPLNKSGLDWIISLIKSGRNGFRVTDQYGKVLEINTLVKEREEAIFTGKPGPTSIFVEFNNILQRKIAQNNHIWLTENLHKPAYVFLGDHLLL